MNIPRYVFALPWFMFDLYNKQLITTPIIPGDISDTKGIVLVETPIPGLNYAPIQPGGNSNRKISFTLQLVKRNNTVGNVLMLKQFDQLRNQGIGLGNIFSGVRGQFTPNPKVLYYWGIGSAPLEWYVSKCDVTHKKGWVNQLGYPQYSEISIELTLDETSPLYKLEEAFRTLSALGGEALSAFDVIDNQLQNGKAY